MQTRLREVVEEAVSKLMDVGEEVVSYKPTPQKWSAKEILGHLIDSAHHNHGRFVGLSLEDGLEFPDNNQDDWVRFQRWQDRPWQELLTLWGAYNQHLAWLIEQMTPEELEHRGMVFLSRKTVTLGWLVEHYVGHLEHHLGQIWQQLLFFKIRPARFDEAEPIAAMIRAAWAGKVAPNSSGHKETAEKVEADLHKGYGWVVEQDDQIIATVRMTPHPSETDIWEMKKLGVLPEFRKHGLGPKLVQVVLDKAHELGIGELRLAVRFDQYRLVEWYSQFGFVHDPDLKYSSPNPNNPPEFVMSKRMGVVT